MMPRKLERNKDMVEKRWKDPKKWTFQALGAHFHLNKKTVHTIWVRDKKTFKPIKAKESQEK